MKYNKEKLKDIIKNVKFNITTVQQYSLPLIDYYNLSDKILDKLYDEIIRTLDIEDTVNIRKRLTHESYGIYYSIKVNNRDIIAVAIDELIKI